MNRISIVTSGYLPVPDVLGGAVEGLVTCLARENGCKGALSLTVYTMDDPGARRAVDDIGSSTRFVFVSIPSFVKAADRLVYWFAKNVLRKKRNMSWAHVLQRVYYLRRVAELLACEEADLLVLENHPTQCMVLDRCGNAARYRGKTLLHLHNEIVKDFGYRKYLDQMSSVICVSSFIARSFADFMDWSQDDRRLLVLRNCAINPFFTRGRSFEIRLATRERLGIAANDFVVLFSGRLTEEKGASQLIDAFAKANVPASHLLISGAYFFKDGATSSFEEDLKSKAAALGDRVTFTGYVDHCDMADVYAACDVVCNPSIWDDPAPLSNIEGLAAGKPIISTYSGGIPEYVDSSCGILIERGECMVDDLASAISSLGEDPVQRKKLSDGARRVAKDLNVDSYYSRFCKIIKKQ